jgi:hypothetical protein
MLKPEQEAFLAEFADRELKIRASLVQQKVDEEAIRLKEVAREQFIADLQVEKSSELESAIEAYDKEHA